MNNLWITKEIAKLQKEIITTGMDKLRSSNIEKQYKLNKLIKKAEQPDIKKL
jgi:hypothetical protein